MTRSKLVALGGKEEKGRRKNKSDPKSLEGFGNATKIVKGLLERSKKSSKPD